MKGDQIFKENDSIRILIGELGFEVHIFNSEDVESSGINLQDKNVLRELENIRQRPK
ncbi:MAG TPA: hypothetical protein VJB67_01050 [Patescibacteria group bacterium]|nr:hypothetical protein [Patescibacteria group bacterium]